MPCLLSWRNSERKINGLGLLSPAGAEGGCYSGAAVAFIAVKKRSGMTTRPTVHCTIYRVPKSIRLFANIILQSFQKKVFVYILYIHTYSSTTNPTQNVGLALLVWPFLRTHTYKMKKSSTSFCFTSAILGSRHCCTSTVLV